MRGIEIGMWERVLVLICFFSHLCFEFFESHMSVNHDLPSSSQSLSISDPFRLTCPTHFSRTVSQGLKLAWFVVVKIGVVGFGSGYRIGGLEDSDGEFRVFE